MTYETLLANVETVMATWSHCDLWGPNQRFDIPDHTGDPSAPAKYVAWELRYPRRQQATMGGTVERRGVIAHGGWIEKDADEGFLSELVDLILAHWDTASITDVFLLPKDAEVSDEPAEVGEWRGIEVHVPWVHFEEAA